MANFNPFTTASKSIQRFGQHMTRFSLIFAFIFSFYTEGSSQCTCTNCGCTDSLELVKLYNFTNGPSWRTPWILAQPMSSWYGITLSNGQVTKIIIQSNALEGTLPPLNLPKLEVLSITLNLQLGGVIPAFNLPNLSALDLRYNQLTGSVPNFNLPNLVVIYLNSNKLNGTIANFNAPELAYLDFNNNLLTGSIPNFNMPYLQRLWLYNNQLTGPIPNFNMLYLESLSLSTNQLTGAIPNFTLPRLKFLSLEGNQLSGCIPREIKTKCPLIGQTGGNIKNNLLPTEFWNYYWTDGDGACAATAVNDVTADNVRIYPNPAHQNLFVEGISDKSKILICNVLGELILTTEISDKAININTLNNGIYILRIISAQKECVRLFVKE